MISKNTHMGVRDVGPISPRHWLCQDATAIAHAIRTRQVSASEIIETLLAMIPTHNQCNALILVNTERARTRAREVDAATAQGKFLGPLHGVPFTVKDAFDISGLRTTVGHPAYIDRTPDQDAAAVRKLVDAGAILLAKSNCAALCCDVQTNNRIFGRTTNPWDIGRTAGGSSGGEAAAVAMGLSPLGIASDTGGSIRIPGSYCGVLGFKPSLGGVCRDGLLPSGGLRPECTDSLTTVGSIARSPRDLALCHEVLSGEPVFNDRLGTIRLACSLRFPTQSVEDEVADLLITRCMDLAKTGINIDTIASPLDIREIHRLYMQLCLYEFMPRAYSPMLHGAFRIYDKIASWLGGTPDAAYSKLKRRQLSLSQAFDRFLADYDAWIIPSTPTTAFTHRRQGAPIAITVGGRTKRQEYMSAIASLAYPANLLGNPSITLPVATDRNGLPIGMQLIGRRGQDQRLLAIASEVSLRLGVDAAMLARKTI